MSQVLVLVFLVVWGNELELSAAWSAYNTFVLQNQTNNMKIILDLSSRLKVLRTQRPRLHWTHRMTVLIFPLHRNSDRYFG